MNTKKTTGTEVVPEWAGKVGVALRIISVISPTLIARLMASLWFKPFMPKAKPHVRAWYDSADKIIPLSINNVYIFGQTEDPIVLCIHGWRGRAHQLRHFVEPLNKRGFRVALINLPGHGDYGRNRTDLYECAYLIQEVWGKAGPIDSIIAHSLGSPVSVLSLDEKRTPRKLALIASNFDLNYVLMQYLRAFDIESLIDLMEKELIKLCDKHIFKNAWQQLTVDHFVKRIKKVQTCLFFDPEDKEINSAVNRDICQRLKNTELKEIHNVGHFEILKSVSAIEQICYFLGNSNNR